jgi:pilus assembly protein CpaB
VTIRTVSVVVLALLCGAFAAVGVYQLQRQSPTASSDDAIMLVTAAVDIPRGQLIEPKLLKLSYRRSGEEIPTGAIGKIDEVVGRSALVPLVKGEVVLRSRLANKNAGRELAVMIPDGMRAFAIQTPQVSSDVGGFIRPGNRVDVLLTTTASASGANESTGGGVTTTLLQNIEVRAVAQKLDMPDDGKFDANEIKSVTLLVTPDQAAKLSLGMNRGILHLSLRNPNDNRNARTAPVTLAQLRFDQDKSLERAIVAAGSVLKTLFAKGPEKAVAPVLSEIRTLRGSNAGSIPVNIH